MLHNALGKPMWNNEVSEYPPYWALVHMVSGLKAARESWVGLPLGRNDRNGDPIHIGDTVRFDEREWGAPNCVFVVEYDKGEYMGEGCLSDLSQWCDIVKKWDEHD